MPFNLKRVRPFNWRKVALFGAAVLATASSALLWVPQILDALKESIRHSVMVAIEGAIDRTVRKLIFGYGVGFVAFAVSMLILLVFPSNRLARVVGALVLLGALVYNSLFLLQARRWFSTVVHAGRYYRRSGVFRRTVAFGLLDAYRETIDQAVTTTVSRFTAHPSFPRQARQAVHDFALERSSQLQRLWIEDRLPDCVPSIDELWEDALRLFGRRVLILATVLGSYVVLFVCVVRPLSLRAASGLPALQVYSYPFALAVDALFGTSFVVD